MEAGKLAEPVAKWAEPAKLPPLKWAEGGKPLGRDVVAYLLYRQSRAKEIRPDDGRESSEVRLPDA